LFFSSSTFSYSTAIGIIPENLAKAYAFFLPSLVILIKVTAVGNNFGVPSNHVAFEENGTT
jgi:hypothetical protein